MRWAGVTGRGWLRGALAIVFFAACAAAVAATGRVVSEASLIGVRLGGDDSETRIVLDLDRSVSAQVNDGDAPVDRVQLGFPGLRGSGALRGPGRGLVRDWMLSETPAGAQLTLSLTGKGQVRRRFLLPPSDALSHYRYVIDIDAAGASGPKTATVAAAATVEASPTPAFVSRHDKKIIVIDPGHGGQDPGAQSGRHQEKILTLQAALVLKTRLEADGRYQVVLTRTRDVFVPLDERVRIARRAGADLFVSLHADSAGSNDQTHGASIYTLSDEAGPRVASVLDRHEWFARAAARERDPAVGEILLDLTQRSTRNRSEVFAQLVGESLTNRHVDMLPRGLRNAGYFVLLAPDVPAVLLEMGFITNPVDEARLADPIQRRRLADGLVDAIDAYFSDEVRVASR
jgi:N-acetylmuramoyl-L-alanine amidase